MGEIKRSGINRLLFVIILFALFLGVYSVVMVLSIASATRDNYKDLCIYIGVLLLILPQILILALSKSTNKREHIYLISLIKVSIVALIIFVCEAISYLMRISFSSTITYVMCCILLVLEMLICLFLADKKIAKSGSNKSGKKICGREPYVVNVCSFTALFIFGLFGALINSMLGNGEIVVAGIFLFTALQGVTTYCHNRVASCKSIRIVIVCLIVIKVLAIVACTVSAVWIVFSYPLVYFTPFVICGVFACGLVVAPTVFVIISDCMLLSENAKIANNGEGIVAEKSTTILRVDASVISSKTAREQSFIALIIFLVSGIMVLIYSYFAVWNTLLSVSIFGAVVISEVVCCILRNTTIGASILRERAKITAIIIKMVLGVTYSVIYFIEIMLGTFHNNSFSLVAFVFLLILVPCLYMFVYDIIEMKSRARERIL